MPLKSTLDGLYKKLIFRLVASNHWIYNTYHRYLYTPSKGSLAEFLNSFSLNNKGLTIIQVGANDGYNRDPYVKFILRDKWQGVLIEPQPYVFKTYLEKIYHKSDRITALNYAIDTTEGSRTLYKLSFSNARWATGLSTFDKGVLWKAIDSGHVGGHAEKAGIKLPEKREDFIDEEVIKTISPKKLITEYNIKQLDLLAIDTEGFDYEILKMFDIESLKPRVVIYEHQILSEKEAKAAENLMKENGYVTKKFKKDLLAIKPDDKDYEIFSALFK